MALRQVAEEVACDGLRTCDRAITGSIGLARQHARDDGWLILPDVDLCPDCRWLPDLAHLNPERAEGHR